MTPVEIEEAISDLALEPFSREEFAFQFLAAFGNKETTLKKLRAGASNASDIDGGVLQRNNIHIATCSPGAIYGDGTGNAPTGVWNTAGINAVSMATNGAALTNYDKLVDTVYQLQLDNAADPTAMILHPRTSTALAKLKDADNNPLVAPDMIARIPRLVTTSAPIDEVEGTETAASSIVFGDFTQLMIGMRTQLEIRVYDQPYASTGQLYVAAWLRADVQLAQPTAFAKLTGIAAA